MLLHTKNSKKEYTALKVGDIIMRGYPPSSGRDGYLLEVVRPARLKSALKVKARTSLNKNPPAFSLYGFEYEEGDYGFIGNINNELTRLLYLADVGGLT